MNTTHLPLFIDLSGRRVVIFGGGSVGERKALLFSQYTDDVHVVSRDFTRRLKNSTNILLTQVEDLTEETIHTCIKDAFIVIPATNNVKLNNEIAGIARRQGALVNRVDGAETEVIVPSIIQQGDITIALSTGASSPALAKYLRRQLEEIITPEVSLMAQLQEELREILKNKIPEQRERRKILWEILEDEAVWSALSESYEKAYTLSLSHISKEQFDGRTGI